MHHHGLRIATACALLGQAAAQFATRTVAGELQHAQPAPTALELLRRQRGESAIDSGTLSITIAPDETCGFDRLGDPVWTCQSNHRCSWESGRLNLAFCGWQSLATTCIDSTAATDPAQCDDACQSNTLNAFCSSSIYPYCVVVALGDGVSTWGCNNESSTYSIQTTQSLSDREFSTMILVDGTAVSTYITSSTSEADTTTSTTEPPSSTSHSSTTTTSITSTSQTSSPHHGPNVAAIVGGVVGGLAVLGFTVVGVLLILHLRRKNRNQTTPQPPNGPPPPVQPEVGMQDAYYGVTSPTQTEYGASLASPVKSQGQFSPPPSVSPYAQYPTTYAPPPHAPPPQQMPGPGGVQMYELGHDNAGHHHGTIQELH